MKLHPYESRFLVKEINMKLLKNKKVTFVALLAILAVLSTQSVSAMHIMEGYEPFDL